MTPQKTIYITVYLLLLIPTLSIALVTRIFSLKVMMLDGFSGNIIFLITCILCTGSDAYFANCYRIILPNKISVLYLQLRNSGFRNSGFATANIESYEIF